MRLLTARNSMRVWRGPDRGYDQVRRLATATVPTLPAALPLFTRTGWTRVLALDFDAGLHGPDQVLRDVEDATALIGRLGGRLIADASPSGGRHLWVPLWTEHRLSTLMPLLRAMRRRWPSLDITPMTNPAAGCLTGPGSPCIGGGHRELLTPLPEAIEAATARCPRGTVAALNRELGVTAPTHDQPPAAGPTAAPAAPVRPSDGDPALPADAHDFATTGQIPPDRPGWTRSEARLSVLAHAARRGMSLHDVRHLIGDGTWNGMADAYAKYGSRWEHTLRREWDKARRPVPDAPRKSRQPLHQQDNTGGYGTQREWLASSLLWLEHHPSFAGRPSTCAAAVLQALSYISRLTGRTTVAPGGRWLSIAAGLLSETTVWSTLRTLSRLDGSPVRLVAHHRGRHANRYELVPPHLDGHPVHAPSDLLRRVRAARVHAVWHTIGHHARETFELAEALPADRHGRIRKREIKRHARACATSVDAAIARLADMGLLDTGWGWVRRTARTLADVAAEHQVDDLVARRVTRHRVERHAWWDLLALWHTTPAPEPHDPPRLPHDPLTADQRHQWLTVVLATGPPEDPYAPSPHERDLHDAIALFGTLLGAAALPAQDTPTRPDPDAPTPGAALRPRRHAATMHA